MDTVLLIKLNTAAYDYYSFLFSWLETDKNPAAFKLLKSRRLNSIFCVDNQSELVPLKSVEQGFFKWPVILQMFSAAVLLFYPLLSINVTVLWRNWKDHQKQILLQIKKKEIELEVWEAPMKEKGFPDAAFHLLGISAV